MLWDQRSILVSQFNVNLLALKNPPEGNHWGTKSFNTGIEVLIQLVHIDEVVAIEIAVLLVLLLMHVYLLYLGYLPEEVLLVDGVTCLVHLWQLVLEEGPHLKHTQHLFLLEKESIVVGEELDLEGIGELLYHLIVEEVQEFG